MPAVSRTVFLSLQAAALLAAVGPSLAPLSVVAAPVPMSHIADYASQPPARTNATLPQVQDLSTSQSGKDDTVVDHTPSDAPSLVRRQSLLDLDGLATALQGLLSGVPDLGPFLDSNQLLIALKNLLEALRQLRALNDVGQQKGLKNYDRNNALETVLKTFVNDVKYLMNDVTGLVEKLDPPLGQLLGRIVYLVKCIVDAVLDTAENVTDGIISNGLVAELQALLAQLSADGLSMGGGDGLSADGVPANGALAEGMPTSGLPVDGLPGGGLPVGGLPVDGLPGLRRTLGYAVRL
ncbi:hypothetical protein OH76DRAFT_1396216 [Lentinus brumalis]|uniref:Uncharacterized protein n=1 Tax=Lentinus brumalis TaxID=2498619 RepID=A0A371DTM5_9APHY|nr:hypothetical protein OH76DRAFT_1396216 [Polyporus brumalis]